MAPVRKKSRLSSSSEALPQPDEKQPDLDTTSHQQQDEAPAESQVATATGVQQTSAPPENKPTRPPATQARSSWYAGGSWRAKASPVAQVARESIQVEQGVSSESPNHDESKRRPSQSVSRSMRGSRKSITLVAEASRIHATSDAGDKSLPPKKSHLSSVEKLRGVEPPAASERRTTIEVEEAPLPPEPQSAMPSGTDADSKSVDAKSVENAPQAGPWFGWWSRPDDYGSDGEKAKNAKPRVDGVAAEEASGTPLPGTPAEQPETQEQDPGASAQGKVQEDPSNQLKPEMSINPATSRSWFGLWSTAQNQAAAEEEQQMEAPKENPNAKAVVPEIDAPADPVSTAEAVKSIEQPSSKDTVQEAEGPKSSGWAFWSTDKPKGPERQSGDGTKQVGELAVADTPSQSHPEAAQFNQEQEAGKTRPKEPKRAASLLRPDRGRPERANAKNVSGDSTAVPTPAVSQLQTPGETPEASPAPIQRGKRPLQSRPNIILPTFRDTYPPVPSQGYFERLAQYLAQTLHIPGSEPPMPPKHPFVSTTPPTIRKAIAIGVHGFFPAPLIQKVLGQPTGTSIRFANYAADSIKQWCRDHQPEVKDVEIETVALEGEGLINDRLSTLWKLLLNWLSHLRHADFILVAAHSQGVPVAIMLVAKLIQLGALSPNVRIGICAMAGINLGPFIEYKSRLFAGSALELFDFCESSSKVSVAYSESLEICLRHGVRVTFIGSLDDQLVSMESSLHSPLTHPYVSRTVFVDGRLHAPNFLTHLVIFAVKLRNLGVSDHGLLREISAPLAGSLVGGEGHSRVYDDPAVYQQATEFALESTEVSPATFAPAASAGKQKEDKVREEAATRRASMSGYPSSMMAANHMRRGSLTGLTLAAPGIQPVIAAYEAPGSGSAAEKNPFVLPWAVRGMLEEALVKQDPKLQAEVKELVKEFEDWRPTSKVLKDVRWRLEGVRSML